jgi:hypothetical protein
MKIYEAYPKCWGCGDTPTTEHHVPPRCMTPRFTIKIPVCKKCHAKLNSGADYTAREKRSLRSNIRKIEKATKNIRKKLLDNATVTNRSEEVS